MRLHLLVPDLWPPPDMEHACEGLRLPGLEWLLGRGTFGAGAGAGCEAWLCQAFGVPRQADWPVAPLTLLADGGQPGSGFWLRADPVHLRVDGARLILTDSSAFTLSQDEAGALTDALNRHFAAEGLVFEPRRPHRWYLRAAAKPDLVTCPLADVVGHDVDEHLPSGTDALRWHALLNEAQMALHEHPVNVERDARGDPAVNSVWFWGGGTLPDRPVAPFAVAWADDALTLGLARLAGMEARAAPTSAQGMFTALPGQAEHLAVLDGLGAAARYGDVFGWREGVQALEKSWFAPLAAALQARKLARLVIVSPGRTATRELAATASDLWKFWRGPRPLSA